MKIITTINGSIGLYLQPESEIEKLVLNQLFSGPVDTKQHATIQIAGKNLVDCVEIISAAKTQVS
jgi:hypothetical protein